MAGRKLGPKFRPISRRNLRKGLRKNNGFSPIGRRKAGRRRSR